MTGPSKPLGMSDFFALEAGEYLERLDGLLAKGESPSADELVRLARALRGSALMANQPAIARAAAGLEALGRAVREGRRAWDAATRHLAVRGVDDLKVFVRRAASWTDADTAKAEGLAHELEQQAGRPSAQVRAVEALGLDAGARAFVAREGAAIASALDRAAQTLRGNPLAHDPLQQVLRALPPLRGLGAAASTGARPRTRANGPPPPRSASCARTPSARRSARSPTRAAACSRTASPSSPSPRARPWPRGWPSTTRPGSPPSCAASATCWRAPARATKRQWPPSSTA